MQEKGVPLVESMKDITPVQRVVLEYALSYWNEKENEETQKNTPNI
jgi:hypothetical protein